MDVKDDIVQSMHKRNGVQFIFPVNNITVTRLAEDRRSPTNPTAWDKVHASDARNESTMVRRKIEMIAEVFG